MNDKINMEQLVVALGLLPVVNRPDVNVECPICGRKKLNINFRRDIFACPACDTSGGVMDAWALFRGINAHSKTETRRLAKIDMVKFFGEENNDKYISQPKKKWDKESCLNEVPLASLKDRDIFYRAMLDACPLYPRHRKNLRDRGLTDEQISSGYFRSCYDFSSKYESVFKGISGKGAPGVYEKAGKEKLVYYGAGILIPEWSVSGKIQGLQIRMDKGDCKYISLSSIKEGGTKGRAFTSFSNAYNNSVKEVILTEGPLKGAVINFMTKVPVIAIPGVNSQRYLPDELLALKERGMKKIIICYDMDYLEKKSVQNGLLKLRKTLADMEIPYVQYTWDASYKGYDDYLLNQSLSK